MGKMTYEDLTAKALWVRRTVLEMAVGANSGHITSAYSMTELIVALYYGGILRFDPKNVTWPERDRFLLSKGQGGIGLYPVLADLGFFPLRELENYTGPGSRLGIHLEHSVPGLEAISGSLGHGLPLATGMCEAARLNGAKHLVVCLLGDGELYEGSNWEAATCAGHRGYDNLVCIVDRNGQATLGFSDSIDGPRDGPRLDPLDKKFEAFGFEVRTINGHCFPEIFGALADVRQRSDGRPLAVIARTVKGKAGSLMENRRLWHYRVPQGDDVEKIRAGLRRLTPTGELAGPDARPEGSDR